MSQILAETTCQALSRAAADSYALFVVTSRQIAEQLRVVFNLCRASDKIYNVKNVFTPPGES